MSDAVIVLFTYAIGSIPFAYLLSLRTGIDLRQHGSRNLGARNAFEVTKRKDIGVSVLVLDVLKGLLPALLLDRYLDEPSVLPLALVALVLGHCYPIWLRFHGGRGLATAAGILLIASPIVLAAWLAAYFLAKVITSNVHVRTVIALCVSALVTILLSDESAWRVIYLFRSYEHFGIISLQAALLLIILVIATRHIEPLLTLRSARERA